FLGLYKLTKPKTTRILFPIIFVSAFLGDVCAAIAAGAQVGLSNILPLYGLSVAVPVMALNHSIIGVAEGFVTVVLIATLLKLRPDVLAKSPMLGRLSMFQNKNEVEE
ncbi:MAG: energy-coupling factor ABC transporter permease, partial [Betaproteobacteria bacterium]